jgi:hypothetical protein
MPIRVDVPGGKDKPHRGARRFELCCGTDFWIY